MPELNIPTAEQFEDTITNLRNIATALGTTIDTSTWDGVQRAVRAGVAPQLFPIGTQFVVQHSSLGAMIYDVVAHDYLKSAKNETAHTMTLMSHTLLPYKQYDNPEAFYYATYKLSAGTYNFSIATAVDNWSVGTYQFTLTKELPVGGQLCISGQTITPLTQLGVLSYTNGSSISPIETVTISVGGAGTHLGTLGGELNHLHRVAYGSNNYKESAIHQYLNSSQIVGEVWVPQTKYDRPPSWASLADGFVRGLDATFSAIVGEVIIPCSTSIVYESPDSTTSAGSPYKMLAKFYLPSTTEIFGDVLGANDESVMFPYYTNAIATDRIKYQGTSPTIWWTRSPHQAGTNATWVVKANGEVGNVSARSTSYFPVACTIV